MRTVTEYDALTAVTIPLGNLANGNAVESDAINNQTARYLDVMLEIAIVLPAGSPPAGATIDVFVAPSVGTSFPTPATGANGAITIPSDTMLTALYQIPVTVGGITIHAEIMSVATSMAGGLLPPRYSIIVRNNSGLTFAASGHTVQYKGVYALTS